MNPPETLLAAANRIREHATHAQRCRPGQWVLATDKHGPGARTYVSNNEHHVCGYLRPPVARHITVWDPSTALAVALWLEECARNWTRSRTRAAEQKAALDLAHTILTKDV